MGRSVLPLKTTVIPVGSVAPCRNAQKSAHGRNQRLAQLDDELRDRYLGQRMESLEACPTGDATGRCSWGVGLRRAKGWCSAMKEVGEESLASNSGKG